MEEATRICNMDGLLFVLILEVSLLQIRILEKSTVRNIQHHELLDKSGQQEFDKLSRDRNLVKDILRRTLLELAENGIPLTLQQAVEMLTKSLTSYASIQINNEKLKALDEHTNHELITKRYLWEIQLHDCDEKIASLKDQIRDANRNAKAQLCYAEKWISATAEAVELRFQIKPTSLPNENHERRVHDEIARTYELQTKERKELLEQWKIKYVEDTAMISRHVTEQREMLRVTSARRVELQKLYDLHAGEMRAWLTFKRERAARLAREEHAKVAATSIQSWWRGLMVRRALGAFKHLRSSKKATIKKKK